MQKELGKEETDILENLKRKKGSNKVLVTIKGIVWIYKPNFNLNSRMEN